MNKVIITIAVALAIACSGFTDGKPQISYTMPFVITGVDTLGQGLNVRMRPAGEWKPLQSFPKKANDTLWVYKIPM